MVQEPRHRAGPVEDEQLKKLLDSLKEHGATVQDLSVHYNYSPGIGPAVVPVAVPLWARVVLLAGCALLLLATGLLVWVAVEVQGLVRDARVARGNQQILLDYVKAQYVDAYGPVSTQEVFERALARERGPAEGSDK